VHPDQDIIHEFLSLLTAPWIHCSVKGQLEVRFLADGKSASIARFPNDQLTDAVNHIVIMNEKGLNAYVCINPITETSLKAGEGAKDKDVLRAHFAFADCDEPGCAERLKSTAPKHSFHVITGTKPHLRCHFYWQFTEPLYNLMDWKVIQAGISSTYGSDSCIKNPSRLMRIAGTVSYPSESKKIKGYETELTELRLSNPVPIAFETIKKHLQSEVEKSTVGSHISGPLNRPETRSKILSSQEWHNNTCKLVASYVSKGLDNEEIQTLCSGLELPNYTPEETSIEVQNMIDSARKKGFAPKPPLQPATDPERNSPLLTMIGEIETKPCDYLIDQILERKTLIGNIGQSGSGKSFVAIDMAMSIATGLPYHGHEVKQGLVVLCAGEGTRGIPDRTEAWCIHHSIDIKDAKLALTDRAAQLFDENYLISFYKEIEDLSQTQGPPELIIIDTVARHMAGLDENSAKEMGELITISDRLKIDFDCAVMLVHHTGHSNQDRARGSTAFKGALDTEIIVKTAGEHDITLGCEKQKDGPPFERMQFMKTSVGQSIILQVVPGTSSKKKSSLSYNETIAMKAFESTINNTNSEQVHLDDWRKEFNQRHTGDNEKSKATSFRRARNQLVMLCFLSVKDDIYSLGDKAT